jgi:hypothetical protein
MIVRWHFELVVCRIFRWKRKDGTLREKTGV